MKENIKMGICRTLVFFLHIIFVRCDYFGEFEQALLHAEGKQATLRMRDEFLTASIDKPKEIEITCPGDVSPSINIKDIVEETASAYNGEECMTIKMVGANFHFRMSINCESTVETEVEVGV